MIKTVFVGLIIILSLSYCTLYAIEVYSIDGTMHKFNIEQLRKSSLVKFTTERHKDGLDLQENWQGLDLQKWLQENRIYDFQSIRFESADNYMVRIHKAEMDSMRGYIALYKDDKVLENKEVRVIFPKHRDMYWVRGVEKIYLEDFKKLPPPDRIFIWDVIASQLSINTENFSKGYPGYVFDDVMQKIFRSDTGSVVLVSRDGLKTRLEYPKHLLGSFMEKDNEGSVNLKSSILPSGMLLKDIVYIQCGPYATIKYDYLYQLPTLYKILEWDNLKSPNIVIKASVAKSEVPLESLFQPDSKPFEVNEWIELK